MSTARILVQDVPKHLHEATEYFDPEYYSSEIALLKDQQNNPTNLFWVSDDMAAIAVDAAQAEDFPLIESTNNLPRWSEGASALVLFEKGTGIEILDFSAGLPTDDDEEEPDTMVAIGFLRIQQTVYVIVSYSPKTGDNYHQVDQVIELERFAAGFKGAALLLQATFLLMGDSSITQATTQKVKGKSRRKHGKRYDIYPAAQVRSVRVTSRLIQESTPAVALEDEVPAGQRQRSPLGHQVLVRGHWRNVPYGQGRALRRHQWIMPYVKGPEGAPLVNRPLVKTWR